MVFIGLLLAIGTIAILGYAGYVLYNERRAAAPGAIPDLPIMPKYSAPAKDQQKAAPVLTGNQSKPFIDFVAGKFNKDEYRLDRKGSGQNPPDLLFRLSDSPSIQFAIACHHTSAFSPTNALEISPEQIDNYYRFQQDNNYTVFVILGAGGTPEKPEKIFVVPLHDIPLKQQYLPSSYLSRYRKLDMRSNFFLLPERMLLI